MASKLIIRVQTSQGMSRITLASRQATLGDLRRALAEKYHVKPEEQILSYTPPATSPDFLTADDSTVLSSIKLTHGAIVHLVLGDNHRKAYQETRVQTMSAMERAAEAHKAARRKPRQMTTADKWEPKEQKPTGPKHVPFHEFMEERQRQYSKQPWNIDPPKHDYSAVPYSAGGVEFKKLPPNAVIKRQSYRHVDVISFHDSRPINWMVGHWQRDGFAVQRAMYLVGRYEMVDDTTRPGHKRMQAEVFAAYEPPQQGKAKGVTLLKDTNEQMVDKVIEACGMERVGWIVTHQERGGEEYHGPIYLTGNEIFTAARLQQKYRNVNTGFTKFVTMTMCQGEMEPRAFMISDQGVAMLRHSLVKQDEDWGFLQVNVPPPGVYVPAVINEQAQVKHGDRFLPDAFLVQVNAAAAKNARAVFETASFPATGGEAELRAHLRRYKDREYHVALSDFRLLCFLPRVMPEALVQKVCHHVVTKQRLSSEDKAKVSAALAKYRG